MRKILTILFLAMLAFGICSACAEEEELLWEEEEILLEDVLPVPDEVEVVPEGEAGGAMDVSLAEDLGDDIDLQAR